jgi:hypothetical protein|tara:strand:+ start:3191 stop:3361 length:171 start_codon:yes stop_codon:yes gene_type:complete
MALTNQQQLEYVKHYLEELGRRDIEAAEEEDVMLSVAIHFLEQVIEEVSDIELTSK